MYHTHGGGGRGQGGRGRAGAQEASGHVVSLCGERLKTWLIVNKEQKLANHHVSNLGRSSLS